MTMESGGYTVGPPPAAPSLEGPSYPARIDVEYPEKLNRFLPFIKWLLAIPHFLILYALGAAASVIALVAFFSILFTKKYPRGLFDFVVNYHRWYLNVQAYAIYLLRDEYPPFSWDAGQYPATMEVDYPEQLNRWLPLIKWLLVIPHLIVLALLYIVWYFLMFIIVLIILFTAKYPRGLCDFSLGLFRWSTRVTLYAFYLTHDEYPPFSFK